MRAKKRSKKPSPRDKSKRRPLKSLIAGISAAAYRRHYKQLDGKPVGKEFW